MQTNEDARAMVEALIYLAHKLKISVCAEGVENEHTLNMLEHMHCDAAQGYLIGDGVNAQALEQLVENWNSRFRTEAVAS
jgi:EAL domain-containing protein (putative c-di-GMP-specific phosphodiesterase class I)